jgi:hypothetical chaperone protein
MNPCCGIDFGTSNSTVGIAQAGECALLPLEGGQPTLPSAIFYDFEDNRTRFGRDAVAAYTEGHEGRLMRALKSILGTSLIEDSTQIGNRRVAFGDIIATFLRHLKSVAEASSGNEVSRVTLGRPVRFVDGDDTADNRAQDQLEQAARRAGFSEIAFQYEPVAAALSYEANLTREELVLVCDIGGGTSDFSLIRVGPGRGGRPDRTEDILANTGVHVGGTDLDYRLSLSQVMPLFGLGSRIKLSGGETAMPLAVYNDLSTWYRIVFLYRPQVLADLVALRGMCSNPGALDLLTRVIEGHHGYRVAGAVEAAKVALSDQGTANVVLDFILKDLACTVEQSRFDSAIAPEVSRIESAIATCFACAGITPDGIDAVFLTGGSTSVPAILKACTGLAGKARIVPGDRFGSVGLGLVIDAAARFGS